MTSTPPRRALSRRAVLAATVLSAAAVPPPAAAQATALSERDRADLARIEAYLNGLTTLRARFLQIAQNGATAEGTAWIWRPGRMRFEYDPPEPLLLVASHGQFLLYDRELRQPSTVPVSQTPLAFLLRENLRLSGDVTVTRVERGGGFLRVTLHRTAAPAEGRLTLVFQEDPIELRQWAVVDAQARETRVSLSRIETGVRIDPRIFEFNDPRFFEETEPRRGPPGG
ncbi:outer-membrane lipoprotein carrier protein [Caldovatus sediminis]|uniref:Outer-membrane lipoprotein carrier protein n=1 Tax=Caldovatus sediminis TaxID=2041189 RepID=A0A8J3EC21_9PROT|nr:outer membrane lipoprotein carrier protein LolA [Caldovatus sediminis]GGG31687.1 outer-membrane lipoprotein carrier protein [Caldovatus sediminis]